MVARATRSCRRVVAGLMVLAASGPNAAGARPPEQPRAPLVTPWPSPIECPHFERLELAVDEHFGAVEWRGGAGTSPQLLPVTPIGGSEEARDSVVKASRSFPCGDEESLCLLYPHRADRNLHTEREFFSARLVKPIAPDFPVGQLHTLVVRPADNRPPKRPHARSTSVGFGLRIILSCADPARPSLTWACDERGCLLQTFRTNTSVGTNALWALAGPFKDEWERGVHAADLAHLLGQSSGELKTKGATLATLARALADELARVIEFGCTGAACSARVAALRERSRLLAAAADLRLVGVTAMSARVREFGQHETGWVARLRTENVEAELACARHYHHLVDDNPPHDQCRLSVFAGGARLGDYFPYWFQQIELPDGGGIELRGSIPKLGAAGGPAWGKDQIVITGSALSTAP